jgi:site-specific DNA recombinase
MALDNDKIPAMANDKKPLKWVAIYTRKSTDENLGGDFTSLDSQREYCQAFIKSREAEGWRVFPVDYNDPGFTGGNMDRPGLKHLMSDARQGKFQAVVTYKYDRLSRNTKDFLHVLDIFDKQGIVYVSVTQPIDTGSSVGRLMRSILVDFSQFERELISERTRDKRAAMARKGKWSGGPPVLGYDADEETKKLGANAIEAKQVRLLYETYLQTKSLSKAAILLNKQGLRMKKWTTRKGNVHGGRRFNKGNLDYVLRNPVYIGKISHKGDIHEGEHKGIVEPAIFERVSRMLAANGKKNTSPNQDKHNFMLRGLVRCGACGHAMTPNFAYSKGRKYFYYKCVSVGKLDKSACPTKSAPARELERLVLDRIAYLGKQKDVVNEVVERARQMTGTELPAKQKERVRLIAEIGRQEAEVGNITAILAAQGPAAPQYRALMDKLGQVQERREELEKQVQRLDCEVVELESRQIDAEIIRRNLESFSGFYTKLPPPQQKELLALLVGEVVYDPAASKMKLTLRPLPDLGFQVVGDKVSFDERLNWLPERRDSPN